MRVGLSVHERVRRPRSRCSGWGSCRSRRCSIRGRGGSPRRQRAELIQLRPLISTGWHDIGTTPSIKFGYISAHIQACMPPIELPMTRRRCATSSASVISRGRVRPCRGSGSGGISPEPVRRLARPAAPDRVRHDDEICRRIERLARHEQFVGEARAQPVGAGAGIALQQQHAVVILPAASRFAVPRCDSGASARAGSRRCETGSRGGQSRPLGNSATGSNSAGAAAGAALAGIGGSSDCAPPMIEATGGKRKPRVAQMKASFRRQTDADVARSGPQ